MLARAEGPSQRNARAVVGTAVAFLHLLFNRPQRATALMLHWHARQPCKGATLQGVWHNFVHALLYAPLNVCVSPSGMWPLGNEKPACRAFFISFAWMDAQEKRALSGMLQEPCVFFRAPEKVYTGGHRLFSGFVANRSKKAFPLDLRKKMLRCFCSLVYQVVPVHRLSLALILQTLGVERAEPFYVLLSKALIGYTPEGPSLTPIHE